MDDRRLAQLNDRLLELEVQYPEGQPGVSVVVNRANGHVHQVTLTTCDCADYQRRDGGSYDEWCKHIWAVRLSESCPICGDTMILNCTTDDFECSGCKYAMMGVIVRERRTAREVQARRVA